jgi:hypothetical protein
VRVEHGVDEARDPGRLLVEPADIGEDHLVGADERIGDSRHMISVHA